MELHRDFFFSLRENMKAVVPVTCQQSDLHKFTDCVLSLSNLCQRAGRFHRNGFSTVAVMAGHARMRSVTLHRVVDWSVLFV